MLRTVKIRPFFAQNPPLLAQNGSNHGLLIVSAPRSEWVSDANCNPFIWKFKKRELTQAILGLGLGFGLLGPARWSLTDFSQQGFKWVFKG